MSTIQTILVPTDFSDCSHAAWRYAQTLAEPFGSTIHLLHVVALPYMFEGWSSDVMSAHIADLVRHSEESARKELAALVPATGPLAGRVTTAVRSGLVPNEILAYILEQHIDMVVVGTHGRGAVGTLLLGSVTERLVRRSPVPVLTVRHTPGR